MQNCVNILEEIGWPTDLLVLDFEVYYDTEYSLSRLSTIEFITDKRFEFTGIGTAWNMGDRFAPMFNHNVPTIVRALQKTAGRDLERATIIVANAKFDITILKEKFEIDPPYVVDIQDLARYYDSRMRHHLKDLAKLFEIGVKGNTEDFKGFHLSDMNEEKRTALGNYCKNDIVLESEVFLRLLPLLTNPKMELALARHTLGLYLNAPFTFDFHLAKQLGHDMDALLLTKLFACGHSHEDISGNNSFAAILEAALPDDQHVPTKHGKRGLTPCFAKSDVEFQELLKHPDPKVRALCEARQAVRSWPSHTKRIASMRNQAECSGGKLRVPLRYYGCHTGRWSGGEGINLTNLGGRGRAGSGNHPLISKVRNLLSAGPEHMLLIADSAQIEARVLAWLAGQNDLIAGFANNEDIYSQFATVLFRSPVRKPTNDDPKPVADLLNIRRGFGKDAILGAGYGMGASKFYDRCYSNEELRPSFESGQFTVPFIETLISTYRKTYCKIPEFWGDVESKFRLVIKYPGKELSYGGMKFTNTRGTVVLTLPSGRNLFYRHAHLDKTGTIKYLWGALWGGSITENIVQSVSRDLLVYWLLQCEYRGTRIIFHCYDELVGIAEESKAEYELERMKQIMTTTPEWAEGLPLGVEGEISKVYKK